MKRRDFFTFMGNSVLGTVILHGCSQSNTSHPVATPEKRAEYLAKMLKLLCTDLGPHPAGSPEYEKAARIIHREMETALPVAELDRYYFEKWEILGEPDFILGERKLETYPAHGCSGTPPGGIRGILKKIDANGIPYGVVDESGETMAHVTVSSYGRAVPHHVDARSLPRFDIGNQDAQLLEAAVKNRTPVTVNAQVRFVPSTPSWNIVGTLPGKRSEEILFLAHADTVYNSPGANDNTASMITMLMLAHAVSGTQPDYTLTFVATGGEEYGMGGAHHYAGKRESEGTLKDIRFIVNFDSLTYGPDLWVYTEDKELQTLIQAIHDDLHIKGTPKFFDSDGFQLDASPFRESGARAVYINSRGYNEETLHLWHRPEDLPETVHMDCVENSFQVFREYIVRVQKL